MHTILQHYNVKMEWRKAHRFITAQLFHSLTTTTNLTKVIIYAAFKSQTVFKMSTVVLDKYMKHLVTFGTQMIVL